MEKLKAIGIKIILLFILFFFVGVSLGVYIEKTLSIQTHTVSTMYVVQRGDTLIDICWDYQQLDYRKPYIYEFMDEIKKLNPNLTADILQTEQ